MDANPPTCIKDKAPTPEYTVQSLKGYQALADRDHQFVQVNSWRNIEEFQVGLQVAKHLSAKDEHDQQFAVYHANSKVLEMYKMEAGDFKVKPSGDQNSKIYWLEEKIPGIGY